MSNLYADEAPQVSNLPSDVMRYSRLVGVPRVVNIKVRIKHAPALLVTLSVLKGATHPCWRPCCFL